MLRPFQQQDKPRFTVLSRGYKNTPFAPSPYAAGGVYRFHMDV